MKIEIDGNKTFCWLLLLAIFVFSLFIAQDIYTKEESTDESELAENMANWDFCNTENETSIKNLCFDYYSIGYYSTYKYHRVNREAYLEHRMKEIKDFNKWIPIIAFGIINFLNFLACNIIYERIEKSKKGY